MTGELTCLNNSITTPAEAFSCINSTGNNMAYPLMSSGIFAIILISACSILGIERGFAVAGFFGTILGLAFFWLGWIPLPAVLLPFIIGAFGIVTLIIQINQ